MNSLQLVAKWLYENIAEGDLFTTHDLRTAIPGVEQIDRRMRDLRDHGWVIDTYREDGSLSAEQKRLVHVGEHLWE